MKKYGFALIAFILIADQLSKWAVLEFILKPAINPAFPQIGFIDWISQPIPRLPFTAIEVLPFFNWVMVWNDGVSFGMMSNFGPWPLIAVAMAISAIFMVWMWRAYSWPQLIASAMIVGGALGNIIDRLRFGAVADFLDFHAFGWHFPAFNLADSCITLGIALLLFDSVFLEPRRNKGL